MLPKRHAVGKQLKSSMAAKAQSPKFCKNSLTLLQLDVKLADSMTDPTLYVHSVELSSPLAQNMPAAEQLSLAKS
jgi:hypothetical protein